MEISTGSLLADFCIVLFTLCNLGFLYFMFISDSRGDRHLYLCEEALQLQIDRKNIDEEKEATNFWEETVKGIYKSLDSKIEKDDKIMELAIAKVKSDLNNSIAQNNFNTDRIKKLTSNQVALNNLTTKKVKKNKTPNEVRRNVSK
jgi:hypothetical protein